MPDYDFHTLSHVDFEDLTRDLLQASEGIVLQSFKVGRDRGVDLRYAVGSENWIVQCKHLRKSGYAALVREVRREVPKIECMNPAPSRYTLATSVELSDANKEELAKILGMMGTRDILGANDLNNLLDLHEEIQRRHYKLWLSSTTVMQRVLHNAQAMQTDFEFRRIIREVPRFVQTAAYGQASELLKRERVLVLSGLPGVGKSTIADALVYEKFSEGYEPIIARNGFEEARALFKQDVKQVFLYDDFLGATFLGEGGSALVRNEDRSITDFLNVVADDESKLLILTTREHILAEAVERSERLRHSSIRDFRYIVSVGAYTGDQRARILYNHAYFNRVPQPYLHQLLHQDLFLKIIEHPKFSPRVIAWLTDPRRVKKVEPYGYSDFALRLLDNPAEIWRHAYDEQISEAARSILLTLHSLNGRVSHERLFAGFETLHAERAARYGFMKSPQDFLRAIRILGGGFLTIDQNAVQFIDPSVRDLMNEILHESVENVLDILRGAVSMTQVETVWSLAEMRDGEHIHARIDEALATLVTGIDRAMSAKLFFDDGTYQATFSPRAERRLELLVDIAKDVNNRALDHLIVPGVEQTIKAWEVFSPDVPTATRAIRALDHYLWNGQPEIVAARCKMVLGLAMQTKYDLDPDDMARLLEMEDIGWPPEVKAGLKAMAGRWAKSMGDYLRSCRSEYELERLGLKLQQIGEALDIDLRGPIQSVKVELEMFEPEREPEDDRRHVFKEPTNKPYLDRRAVRDLFATLKPEAD
ncbi:restriction endonuclease [Asticcacaulis sp.]|uniref:nSTAND3 domain-containing NTPase n=1 Tax=Asticcacaulis sp. TaxID=1872648 RepID=UPI002BCFB284|nr:restriction endonuclease [Asticcacaulis sp.]HTM81908.1 restriction endonuclease [Asticcacaulis sp.]